MRVPSWRMVPVLVMMAAGLPLCQPPTLGFVEYPTTFKVQLPYDLPLESRFSDTGGMYSTRIYPNDKPFEKGNTTDPRTEMRWETWKNQAVDNMWEADVMYEPGTVHSCIMQVKNNTSGEAVYLRVMAGGDLYWLGAGKTVLKAYYGKWFNLKASFNPSSATAKVWINDVLVHTQRYNNSRDWYFKNGTYGAEGGVAVAHFKNIKHRIYSPLTASAGSLARPESRAIPAWRRAGATLMPWPTGWKAPVDLGAGS